MTSARVERRLAAVLAADVAGYSRLMGSNEAGTLEALKAMRHDIVDPAIAEHKGRIVKTTGDGMLVEFSSAVEAVTCAADIQARVAERNAANGGLKLVFRIGINVGEVIIDGDDIHGDGVNIAARIEGLCEPGGISISEDAWRQVQGRVEAHFVDAGEQSLKNIARPVRVYKLVGGQKASTAADRPISGSFARPAIAVLSFTNMTGDADQDYLGDGVAEDIITILSRSWLLVVIARNSSFVYKGRAVDVKQIGRELGVHYVLEGSVRRAGNRIRITAQLIDVETGNHLWAERYDRDLSDIFAVQDEITEAVTTAIVPAISKVEQDRAARKAPDSLDAWEAYQRGLWHMGRIGVMENQAAKSFLRQATELDRNFAAARALLAVAMFQSSSLYQTATFAEVIDDVFRMAQEAISLDPTDPNAHACMGWVSFFRADLEGALAEARQALAISPSLSTAHHLLGAVLLFSNAPREGLTALRESFRLDPHSPARHILLIQRAIAHYFLREYDAAVSTAKEAMRAFPEHPWVHRWLAAALGQAGRSEEAMQALQTAISIAPDAFDQSVRQRPASWRPEDHEHMLDGLRKAGWEG